VRSWALSFLAFFAMMSAWALAVPVNGTYDEKQHIVRAYAVATGHLTPVGWAADSLGRRTEAFRAPRSLLPVGSSVDCTWWQPPKPASCQRWVDDRTRVLQPSVVARYSPVYYVAVGLPLAVRPDRTGILVARLVSALLAAALLASAAWLARRSGRRLLAAAVVLTTTPMALNLAAAINPNGLEIAAGIAVATALAVLASGSDRAALWVAGAGSFLLLTVRQLGPVLLALVVAAFLVVAGRDRVRALVRRRDVRWIVGGSWVAGVTVAGGWLLYSGGMGMMGVYRVPRLTTGQQITYLVTHRLPFCFKQMVGQFSYGETKVTPVVIVAWYLLLCLLVVRALRYAGARARLAVVALGVACVGVLAALDLRYVTSHGWVSQGRYVMPAAVGVVLLAAVAGPGEDRLVRFVMVRFVMVRFVVAATAVTVPLQVYTLAAVIARFRVGLGALNPFAGAWYPPVGAFVPFACLLVGSTLAVGVAVRAPGSRTPVEDAHRAASDAVCA
jgi:hypothetical protein